VEGVLLHVMLVRSDNSCVSSCVSAYKASGNVSNTWWDTLFVEP